jgi:hypothetical protein
MIAVPREREDGSPDSGPGLGLPSALRIRANADGVRQQKPRLLGAGVVMLVTVLVGGPSVQLRHCTPSFLSLPIRVTIQ